MESQQTSMTAKTIKAFSSQTVVTLVTAVLNLIAFSIMSRLLTKEDFGYYAALNAVALIFTTLTEAGMGSAVIQHKNPSKQYSDTAFNLSLFTGILFTLLFLCLSSPLSRLVLDDYAVKPMRWISLSILFYGMNSILVAQMTRALKFIKIGILNAIAYVVAAGVAIYMAAIGMGVYAVIGETLFYSVFTFVIFYLFLPEKPKWLYISKQYVKEILGYGGWLSASVLFRMLYQQMDKLLMGRWLSVAALGAYNRPAGFITQITTKLNGILDTILFPLLSSIQDEKERVKHAFDQIMHIVGLYSGILCVMILIGSMLIINIMFGKEWANVIVVLNVLAFSTLLNAVGRIMDCFIRSLAFVKAGFYMRVIACFIMFGCLFVGKEFDIVGVAISIVISNYLIILMKLAFISKKIGVTFMYAMGRILYSQLIIIPPIVVYVIYHNVIWGSTWLTFIALVLAGIYFIGILILFPKLMGDFIAPMLYKNVPFLEKCSWKNIIGSKN